MDRILSSMRVYILRKQLSLEIKWYVSVTIFLWGWVGCFFNFVQEVAFTCDFTRVVIKQNKELNVSRQTPIMNRSTILGHYTVDIVKSFFILHQDEEI